MTHLRTVSNIALLLVAWLAAGLNALAQPAPGLDPRDQALFERAVATSCLGDEAAELASAIRERRAALVPALRRALAAGPPQSAIAAVRSAAERTYAQRAKFVPDESRIGGVDREALARFRSVTRQAFVDDQVQRFVLGYRSNAVAALAVSGDAQARAALERIAANPRDPLSAAARVALAARLPN